MRTPRPSITYEALLAALTLGAMTALPACKGGAIKSEAPPAAQAPEVPPASSTTAPVIQATAPQAQPAPPSPGVASPDSDARRKSTESSVSSTVDAGRELNAPTKNSVAPKPSKDEPKKPGGSAACGGSSCSPDMKKGN